MTSFNQRFRSRWQVGPWVVGTILSIAIARTGFAQDVAAESRSSSATKYLRMTTSEAGEPKTLDVAVTTFPSAEASGATVDLIGAVHIGERLYYEELNKLFDSYDVLLYELVAPENTVIPRGGKRESSNPIAMLQDSTKSMLGLESQLELVDYTKPHFVRADMTPQQISAKMAERGDTALTVALSTLADVMRQQNLATQQPAKQPGTQIEELSLSDMFGNPLKMKQIFARQFATTGELDQSLGGTLNQMLIIDRNAEALKGLQKQLAAGKKKIGIFYGAAHMPDFEKHLVADFGLKRGEQKWLVAWDLQRGPANATSEPAGLLFNLLKSLSD